MYHLLRYMDMVFILKKIYIGNVCPIIWLIDEVVLLFLFILFFSNKIAIIFISLEENVGRLECNRNVGFILFLHTSHMFFSVGIGKSEYFLTGSPEKYNLREEDAILTVACWKP